MRRADTARKVESPLAWSGVRSSSVDIGFTGPRAGLNSTVAKVNSPSPRCSGRGSKDDGAALGGLGPQTPGRRDSLPRRKRSTKFRHQDACSSAQLRD